MRTIKIDFSSGNPKIECDSSAAGIQGEHRASELVIILPPDMPSGLSYRLAFDPGGQSDTMSLTDGELRYELPQSITQHDAVSMTVEGYEGEARIYKSVMVELYFDAAVDTDNPVEVDGHNIGAEVAANTLARHSHSNKETLDKFGETDGNPTYNGQPIGGENTIYIPATLNMSGDSPTIETSVTFEQIDTAYKSGQEQILKVFFDDSGVDSYLMSITMASPGNFYYFGINVGENSMLAFVTSDNYWGFVTYNLIDHTHSNKTVLDKLLVAGGKLQYDGSNVEMSPSQVTSGTSITLADNTEYRLTDVTELSITYPDGIFECWMRLSFAASGTITVTLPSTTQYIGTTPTFANGETWELSIKDGVVIVQKVGDGT